MKTIVAKNLFHPNSGPAAHWLRGVAGPNQPENHQRLANCKTIVAGELFQAARRPQARSERWNGVPSLTSLWSANQTRRAGYGDSNTNNKRPDTS